MTRHRSAARGQLLSSTGVHASTKGANRELWRQAATTTGVGSDEKYLNIYKNEQQQVKDSLC